jgi:spermidine synthase
MERRMKRRFIFLVALITGLSGFCSLVYQVTWDRVVRYNFGGDSISSAIVSGTFLLGLGLGAFLFRKWRSEAYKTYALVEISIGIIAVLSFYFISSVADFLSATLKPTLDQAEGLRPMVIVGCMLLLLPPCTLMGGTLPLMFNCFIGPSNFSTKIIGLIYGINTLGASVGILAVPLVFLNQFSIPTTLTLVGGLNIGIGLMVLLWGRRLNRANYFQGGVSEETDSKVTGPENTAAAGLRLLVFVLAFVSGFVALGFEVSLFRRFQIVNPSSAYNFPAVLMLFLLALALGSIFFTRKVSENSNALLGRVGWLLAGSSVAMFISIWMTSYLSGNGDRISLMPILEQNDFSHLPSVLLFSAVLVMPVPLLTGAIFPLLLRLKSSRESNLPETTGRLYLSNAAGSFAGAILGQFVGFPMLGTQGFLTLLYVLAGALGIGVWGWAYWRGREDLPYGSIALPAGMMALSILIVTLMPADAWRIYITGRPHRNLEVREGVSGVATILWEDKAGHVFVNGQYMSKLPDHPRHVKQSVFLLSQPHRANVLVLGLGGGGVVRALVEDQEVKSVYVVDWSNELPDLLSNSRASAMLNHALASPKVKMLRADARVAVALFERQHFDLIFDNLAFASWVGSSSIKSETYFKKVKEVLKPEGIFIIGTNHVGAARLAVLYGLAKTFDEVIEHPAGEVVICSRVPPVYSTLRIEEVIQRINHVLNLNPPFEKWFYDGFNPIKKHYFKGIESIRDDLLIYEYYWKPWRAFR